MALHIGHDVEHGLVLAQRHRKDLVAPGLLAAPNGDFQLGRKSGHADFFCIVPFGAANILHCKANGQRISSNMPRLAPPGLR